MSKQPNILLLMADQVAASALPFYGNEVVKAPHLNSLAAQSVIFDKAYCNFPLCAPSRFALLSGRLCSRIGAYDNAAELPSSTPTFAHALRAKGYKTCLSGKMHFVGPDQLHGYEERLTTEIYPSDFSWVPNWEEHDTRLAFQDMTNVTSANPAARTMQMDYDEQVSFRAEQKIYDLARSEDERPFFLTVSFTHPHDPYSPTPEYWERYSPSEIDSPKVPFIPYSQRDDHSQNLYYHYGMDRKLPTKEETLKARHGYYASISYIDDKVGRIIDSLKKTGQWENTIVIFTSDHGDMMGERGMWYKKTFFDWSLRVPLLIRVPNTVEPSYQPNQRVSQPVSHIDLFPTLEELAAQQNPLSQVNSNLKLDGVSLVPYLKGNLPESLPLPRAEYLAEGTDNPQVALISQGYKLILNASGPTMLFNIEMDPDELHNLYDDPAHEATLRELLTQAEEEWDLHELRERIIVDQGRRRFINAAFDVGRVEPWDFTPREDGSQQFVRGGKWCANAEVRAHLEPITK